MRRLLPLILSFAAVTPCPIRAQAPAPAPRPAPAPAPAPAAGDIKITFNDGRVQAASSIRRSGTNLLATIALAAGVKGEVGYPLASIKNVEIPEPPNLKLARTALAAGKASEALARVNPVVTAQTDLRTVPGNWWAEAALLKVDALLALKIDREAESLINQLAASTSDPEQMQNAKQALALLWLRSGRQDQAMPVFEQAIAESKSSATLARAWAGKGEILLAKKDYDGALLAFLRVPIFYSNETVVMPPALLGAAHAYEGLQDVSQDPKKDYTNASNTLTKLTQDFPSSSEAATAKADLLRIQQKMNAAAPAN